MPESRDRLSRAVDVASLFARRRAGILGVYLDQPDLDMALFGSPLRRPMASTPTGTGTASRVVRGTPRRGGENTSIWSGRGGNGTGRGRARASGSLLHSWYPRTPLGDITAVVRAIESRRERLGGSDGLDVGSPMPQDLRISYFSVPAEVADLEHNNTMVSPITTPRVKLCHPTVGKLPKLLLDFTNQSFGDQESLTPQKKLLNLIDAVEKVVMGELRKLKRTPTAKKAQEDTNS